MKRALIVQPVTLLCKSDYLCKAAYDNDLKKDFKNKALIDEPSRLLKNRV